MDISEFDQKIDHVVLLMMENRSFDHVLGSLTLDGGRSDLEGLRSEAEHGNFGADNHFYEVFPLLDVDETRDRAYRFPFDPPHDADAVDAQIDFGTMSGFLRAHQNEHEDDPFPESCLGYLTAPVQPITYFLADNFVVCDHWFSPVAGSTNPNRFYALGGQSAGLRGNPNILLDGLVNMPTIFDRLPDSAWNLYANNPTTLHMLKSIVGVLKVDAAKRTIEEFETDARTGNLPRVSWVAPRFSWVDGFLTNLLWEGEANDDHPPSNVLLGQRFIRRIYSAITANPDAWAKTLLVVYYDEHGGFFDHVEPPMLTQDERIPEDGFDRRGPRVPAILVSPYTQTKGTNRVFSRPMDHCSVLKLLCDWFEIDPLTPRVASTSIASVLDAIPEGSSFDPTTGVPAPPPPSVVGTEKRTPKKRRRFRAFWSSIKRFVMRQPPPRVRRTPDENDELFGQLRDRMKADFGDDLSEFGF